VRSLRSPDQCDSARFVGRASRFCPTKRAPSHWPLNIALSAEGENGDS